MSGKMKIYGILMMAVMLFVTSCTTGADEISVGDADSAVPDAGADQLEGSEETAADQAEIKLFVLEGGNYYFEMDGQRDPVITVKQGDRIRVELTSVEGYHDFVVDEFDAATSKVWPEEGMTYIEFTADEKGSFEFYCSVGQHRENGMVGTLIVE